MFARLLFCLAFIFPMLVGSCENETIHEMLMSCPKAQEERFASNEEEGTNEDKRESSEGEEERLASHKEEPSFTIPLFEKTQESIV